MITKQEKEVLTDSFGSIYSKHIQKYLQKRKIYNPKGNTYSLEHIRGIINGKRSSQKLEIPILDLVILIKEKKKTALKKEPKNRFIQHPETKKQCWLLVVFSYRVMQLGNVLKVSQFVLKIVHDNLNSINKIQLIGSFLLFCILKKVFLGRKL